MKGRKEEMKKLKMNFKLVLSLGIVLIAMCLFNTNTVNATEEDRFRYQIDTSTKEVTISCIDNSITEFTIPSTYRGYKITKIDSFENCKNLKNIKIPEGIKSIESYAFVGCTSLKNIVLPNSVTYLGHYAFKSCTSLEKIQLSSNLDYIPDGCFSYCENLKNIIIPKKVTTIGYCAFEYCTNLEKLEILPTVTDINPWAFNENPKLVLYVFRGSEAEMYAINYGITYKLYKYKLDDKSTQVKIANQNYTGKVIKPKVTVKYGKTTLTSGTDYKVSYKNNKNIGTATVTIKGKGNYEGIITKTFKIVPKTPTVKVKAGKKKAIVSWKKVSGATGYQVEMSTKKKSGYKRVKTITKGKTVSYTKTKLKKGKTYYFKVRAYKTVNGKKIYSSYSKVISVKVK